MRAISAEQKALILGSDQDPLHFLLGVVWNEKLDMQVRLSAAGMAVQYLHPKLSAMQVAAKHSVVRIDSQLDPVEAARVYQQLISSGDSD